MNHRRLSWQEYALDLAFSASRRSEDPYQKVGSCALSCDNMVLGLGYNGLAPSKEIDEKFWDNRDDRRKYMVHAEANCLSLCKRGEPKLLAVTLLPCSACATMIATYGIKKVVYADIYERDSDAFDIFKFYNIELLKLTCPPTPKKTKLEPTGKLSPKVDDIQHYTSKWWDW